MDKTEGKKLTKEELNEIQGELNDGRTVYWYNSTISALLSHITALEGEVEDARRERTLIAEDFIKGQKRVNTYKAENRVRRDKEDELQALLKEKDGEIERAEGEYHLLIKVANKAQEEITALKQKVEELEDRKGELYNHREILRRENKDLQAHLKRIREALSEALIIANEDGEWDLRERETRIVKWKIQAKEALKQSIGETDDN